MNWLTKQMMIKYLSDKKQSVNLSFHSYTDPCYTDLLWLDTFVVYCQLITRMLQKQSFFFFFCFFLIYFFIFCVQSCLSVAIINFRQTCDCKRGLLTRKADNVNAVSRGSIVFSSSFQWLYVQLFFVCVCFFSPLSWESHHCTNMICTGSSVSLQLFWTAFLSWTVSFFRRCCAFHYAYNILQLSTW